MNQLTELRPPDFTDVTKWWIFSNKSLLVCLGVMLEAGLFTGVTFPVPDFGSSLLAFGGRTADELIISLIAHRLNRRTYYKNTEWEEEF